ncbi:glycosyltransferase family 2 protein [Aurantibacter sp.]|uniref:glycosyltransferase family 2 protein n=1 Tax=Aurantibacter sp. TaxID=2807103 RepID=UPI0035C86CE0
MEPLVSIITPMYNSENFISESINSIQNQTYTNWELWLIDDCSLDETISIVDQFIKKDSRIHLIKNGTNSGAAISRNKGIEAAKGNYIAFLDADDLWLPQKLEKQVGTLNSGRADVCFSSYEQINESGTPLYIKVEALSTLTYKKLLKSNYVGNLTGMYNASVLGKIKSPNLRKRQDWLIWLKAIETSGKPAIGIQETLAMYRVRENSMSANKFNLVKYNYWVYKKGLGYSTLQSLFKMIIFLKEHFLIKSKQNKTLN